MSTHVRMYLLQIEQHLFNFNSTLINNCHFDAPVVDPVGVIINPSGGAVDIDFVSILVMRLYPPKVIPRKKPFEILPFIIKSIDVALILTL